MKKLILVALCSTGPGVSFDGAAPLALSAPAALVAAPVPVPMLLASPPSAPAINAEGPAEFSQAPSWFDAERLTFDALFKAEGGGTVVMRYGWRSQYEMSVFAFPGNPSVSFTEYSSNPMEHPRKTHAASLHSAAARRAVAKILRAVQSRKPVEEKYKAVLETVLAFLDRQ